VSIEFIHNEKELLHRVAEDDREAFRQLYGYYYKIVQQYVRLFVPSRDNLEELTQDIFIKMWEKRQRLATVDSFKDYIFIVSRNTVFNYFRSLKVQQQTRELDEAMESTSAHHSEHAVLYKQYYHIAAEGMDKLTPRRREILKMRIEQGFTLDEIAGKLGITRAAVKKQLYEATAFVRQYLIDHAQISVVLFVFLSLFDALNI
jgi:RNA polymerase sigma-70 factor (ECF subfamily)